MMLQSIWRRASTRIRTFSTAPSLVPQIKTVTVDAEAETASSDAETEKVIRLRVGGEADIKKLAGKIANVFREADKDQHVFVNAIGINAVNKAVKSIHVARKYLVERPGTHIGFCVNHSDDADKDRVSRLQFLIRPIQPLTRDLLGLEEMWVKGVGRGREVGRRMSLALRSSDAAVAIGIGPRSVGSMIVGLTWARRMLRSDKLDIVAVPQMRRVMMKAINEERISIQLTLMRVPYEPVMSLDQDDTVDDNETSFIEDPMSQQ